MNEELLNSVYVLKEAIRSSLEYKSFVKANEILESSDEVKLLSYKKDMAIVDYEDALKHYNKNSIEVLNSEKNLSQAIRNLNNHQLVKEYNKAYFQLKAIYEKINRELFGFYKEESL